MKGKWEVLNILRHARHDWMNQLQIIKGNLELNKIDRAKEMINEIICIAQQESKLSNLQLPKLAELLITFNWRQYRYQLDYEVNGDQLKLFIDDQQITKWTESFLQLLDQVIEPFCENHLSILIDKQADQAHFRFEFTGEIVYKEKMEQFLSQSDHESIKANINVHNEQVLLFDVYM